MTDNSAPGSLPLVCPQCNSPVADDRKFCESCGAKMNISARCPQCDALVSNGIKFCESCGAPLCVATEDKPSSARLIIPGPAMAPKEIEEPARLLQPSPVSEPPGPKKPLPVWTLAIIGIVILIAGAFLVYSFVLPILSGTGTSEKSGGITPGSITPVSSTLSGSPPTEGFSPAITGTLTAGPTQVPPPNLEVNFQAERDPITGIVTVTFTGGAGQNGVREVVCRLTRSDGQVVSQMFTLTLKGASTSLQGTKMTDRIQVTAHYFNGDQYTVLDQVFEYKKR